MKILLLAFSLVATNLVSTVAQNHTECNACINNNCYKKTSIFAAVGNLPVGQIAIDRTSNIIYFHFQDGDNRDYNAVFDLDYLDFQFMHEVGFTFAHAVDQATRDVFLSKERGLLKFNRQTALTNNYGLFSKTAWHLQFKNKLYYVEFHKNGLFAYDNNRTIAIRPEVLDNYKLHDFVIDKNDDIYFLSGRNVYRLKNGGEDVSILSNELHTLSTDKNGDVHFVKPTDRKLYKLDYATDKLVDIGTFDTGVPFKIIYDSNDNIIYHDLETERLYYVTRGDYNCRVIASTGVAGIQVHKE